MATKSPVKTKQTTRRPTPEPAPAHGWFDWLHRPDWMQALATYPMRIEQDLDGDRIVVRAELAGIDPERDVEINVSKGMLQIRAERRDAKVENEVEGHRHSEFHYGSLARVVSLPAGVVADDVKATYHDGILEVVVPIDHQESAATRVPITRT